VERTAATLWNYETVPSAAVRLFRMAWQLENWLRTIVYVELRAARQDWEQPVKKYVRDWPPAPQDKDKVLHHMTTHHQGALSYLTFGELWNFISDKDSWPLFEPYFPPQRNTQARIEEIKTIRNRIAHCREPHQHDEARLKLFLQDMEQGVRTFCQRYTVGLTGDNDAVSQQLTNSWDGLGYGVELWLFNRSWLYAPPPYRMQLRFPKFGGHEVNGVDSVQGVHRCLGSARRTRRSSSSRP